MEKRTFRLGRLIVGLLVFTLLVVGGGWWFFRSQSNLANSPLLSPVNVFLISPSNGDELNAGDYALVTMQAFAPEAIQSAELFVDGLSLGVATDTPQNASWTWHAWPVGIHTLMARAISADGQMGQSQTVIVNVLEGDGLIQVPAGEGQTLEQIGADFSVPPDQMAGANPKIDPSQPLQGGQPVQIPAGGAGAGNGSGAGGGPIQPDGNVSPGGASIPIFINWQFQPTGPVDKSYCYTSSGDGKWAKMPKEPYHFFFGEGQTQYETYGYILTTEDTKIKMQCWAWLGDLLKFLGEGEAHINPTKQPQNVMISAAGFQFAGMPQYDPVLEKFTGGGGLKTIPPPYAMREVESYSECDSHTINALPCSNYYSSSIIQNVLLTWEWQSEVCWPGYCKYGINKIQGYYIYEIDPLTNTEKYMQEVNNPNQKVSALPLPWGYRCYGVKAYVEGPEYGGQVVSEMATYCPGEPLQTEKIVLPPTDWLTTGGKWIQDGDCDTYGNGDSYLLANQNSGFGNSAEVLVGSYIVDNNDKDCFRQGNYSGGVKFGQPLLPPGAVMQKAVLKFAEIFTDYGASGVATNYKLFCVGGVGKAKQDWTGLNGTNHFVGKDVLYSSAYNSPLSSLSGWGTSPEVDVTAAVSLWIKYPEQNHGFILTPASAPTPAVDGAGTCESGVGNFQLELYYFVP